MRNCGTCSLCCKLPQVGQLNKPAWEWCQHCLTRQHCEIYEDRPRDCREYDCLWLSNPALPEDLRPDRCKVVLEPLKLSRTCLALVDPGRPDAWNKEPVASALRKIVNEGVTVIVTRKGMKSIVILAKDRTIDEVRRDVLPELEAQKAKAAV